VRLWYTLVEIVELTVLFVSCHLQRKAVADGNPTEVSLTLRKASAFLYEADAWFKWAEAAQRLLFDFYRMFDEVKPVGPDYPPYGPRRHAVAA
jgi:hypothetical protein